MRIARSRVVPAISLVASLCLWGLAGGCVSMSGSSQPAPAKVGSFRTDRTNDTAQVTPGVLAAEVARFADEMNALVAQSAENFAMQVGTPQARALALNWRTGAAQNSMVIVSGANPIANLLDMVVMVTLARMSFENDWVPRYGNTAEPMLETCRNLETEIWTVASRVLTPSQREELRALVQAWRDRHPGQVYVGVRLRDFAEIAAAGGPGASRKAGSVFGLLFLDPFAGLDPATREMEQTRYFFERMLYVFQRMPVLLRLQSELLVYQSLAAPDVQQALSNSTRFVQAAEQVAQAIQKLPDQLSAEREKLMSDAVAQAPQWQALTRQFEQTFQAGDEMASSVDAATKSLDAFVSRYDRRGRPPAPSAAATMAGTTGLVTVATPAAGKRFDVTEYGAAAAQIANAAEQLGTLVSSIERSTPQLNAMVQQTGLQGRELVDYAFFKAVWFLGLSLIALVLAMLAYRLLIMRRSPKPTTNRPRD